METSKENRKPTQEELELVKAVEELDKYKDDEDGATTRQLILKKGKKKGMTL